MSLLWFRFEYNYVLLQVPVDQAKNTLFRQLASAGNPTSRSCYLKHVDANRKDP